MVLVHSHLFELLLLEVEVVVELEVEVEEVELVLALHRVCLELECLLAECLVETLDDQLLELGCQNQIVLVLVATHPEGSWTACYPMQHEVA